MVLGRVKVHLKTIKQSNFNVLSYFVSLRNIIYSSKKYMPVHFYGNDFFLRGRGRGCCGYGAATQYRPDSAVMTVLIQVDVYM